MSLHQDSRIFVVDDEHVSASTLAARLQKSGFSARFFTCPREALAAARPEAPDPLISDVMVPDRSGIELAIQMKAQFPKYKVFCYFRAATFDLLQAAHENGYNFHLLLKPAHPSEILSEIKRADDATLTVHEG